MAVPGIGGIESIGIPARYGVEISGIDTGPAAVVADPVLRLGKMGESGRSEIDSATVLGVDGDIACIEELDGRDGLQACQLCAIDDGLGVDVDEAILAQLTRESCVVNG